MPLNCCFRRVHLGGCGREGNIFLPGSFLPPLQDSPGFAGWLLPKENLFWLPDRQAEALPQSKTSPSRSWSWEGYSCQVQFQRNSSRPWLLRTGQKRVRRGKRAQLLAQPHRLLIPAQVGEGLSTVGFPTGIPALTLAARLRKDSKVPLQNGNSCSCNPLPSSLDPAREGPPQVSSAGWEGGACKHYLGGWC